MKRPELAPIIEKLKPLTPTVAFAALSSWLITLSIFLCVLKENFVDVPQYADAIPIPLFCLIVLVLFVFLFCVDRFWIKKSLLVIMPVSFGFYGVMATAFSANNTASRGYTALIFTALTAIVIIFCMNYIKGRQVRLPSREISSRCSFIIVLVSFVLLSAYWILLLWARTESFCSPCFDMGIFTQMYDNMVETGLPYTTCERGEYLSHFAVHFSPVYYLLLPFAYFTKPTVLLVFAQILLVLSGVFPLWLICKNIKLSNVKTTVISLLYLLYPAMSSGSFYDFHENAFLAPFILWTLYFIHKNNWPLTFIFALLVLSVKEDAALYVAFIALYVIFSRKKPVAGILMFVMTVAYFFFAIFMISRFGEEGNMLGSRYANIIGDEGGFTSLVKVFLVNPALYAVELITTPKMEGEKIIYALNMLLPIGLLPLATRKPSRWLLLGPFIVINLVTDYRYQYDLGFQYSFGSGALLVYLAAINLADISPEPAFLPMQEAKEEPISVSEVKSDEICAATPPQKSKKDGLLANTAMVLLVFCVFSTFFIQAARGPAHFSYAYRYMREGDIRESASDVLARVDRNKSIMATSMYLTHLYDANELYSTLQALDDYGNILIYTDVVILDLRDYISDSKKANIWMNKYIRDGYVITEYRDGVIAVLERTEDSPPLGYSPYHPKYEGWQENS